MDNYRPIAMLNVFSKILEKVVCNRLSSFLEKKQHFKRIPVWVQKGPLYPPPYGSIHE
jgi:hypothetical protein